MKFIKNNLTRRTRLSYKQLIPALNKMRLYGATIFAALCCLTSCQTSNEKKQTETAPVQSSSNSSFVISNDSLDHVVNSIIQISASDFYKNQQPLPDAFRNVQLKYHIKPSHEVLYILCGEFSTHESKDSVTWTHFTTIKNIEYEQWIGQSGITYCENSSEISYTKADLKTELISQLNLLQNSRH